MSDLHLSASEVTAVRRVLTIDDPVFESRMQSLLLALHRLVPSDCLGFATADGHGFVTLAVDLPDRGYSYVGFRACDGPLHTGVEHLIGSSDGRSELTAMARRGVHDCLRVGFQLGAGHVAQFWFDRRDRYFEPRHVEILSMLEPAIARLARPPARSALRAGSLPMLSRAERQVLDLVSHGASNRDVADQLSVSEATVRKHLEHVYRKLGVSNRTAASALVRDVPAAEFSRIG